MNSDKKTQQIFKTKQNEPKKNKNLKFGSVIVVKKLYYLDLVKHFYQSWYSKKKLLLRVNTKQL